MRTTLTRVAALVALLLSATMPGCVEDDETPTDIPDRSPQAQVVNNSGGRIDHVKVSSVTFTENLSYNTSLYASDNGTYCGDGCATRFVDVAEGTNEISIGETAPSEAVQAGSLGSFQKNLKYAVNIRRRGDSYCTELWERLDTGPLFNADMTRILISSSC